MGGRSRRMRNAARRAGNPVLKGRAAMAPPAPEAEAPVVPKAAPKKKKAAKKK